MYTGIIKGIGTITGISDKPGLRSLTLELPEGLERNLELGASVALDGVCLTVTHHQGSSARFDVMDETLRLTTLGALQQGSRVNVERSALAGDEVGGHVLSGHVDGTAEIVSVDRPENNHVITFRVTPELMRYIFSKGFVGLNGASLTVVNANPKESTFSVWLIPETLRLTTFGDKRPGDKVNVEIDRNTQVIVETVRRYLDELDEHSLSLRGAQRRSNP